MAATWLGEHVNSVAGEYAWKSWEHKLGLAAAGDPDGLTLAQSESYVAAAAGGGGGGGLGGGGASGVAASADLGRRLAGASLDGGGGAGAGGGGGAAAAADEAVSRLALAGVAHNPLLSLAASHLHRAVMTGGGGLEGGRVGGRRGEAM